MFLRFVRHVRAENWFAVGVELVVLVLGIFLGLQVTDWNQDRLDRKAEAGYLISLQSDLEATRANVQHTSESLRGMMTALRTLASINAENIDSFDIRELDRLIANGMWDLSPLEVQMSTYAEMLSSGNTTIVVNRGIQQHLALIYAAIERFRATESDGFQVQYRNIDPYLADNFPMRRFQPVLEAAGGLPPPTSIAPPDYLEFITRQATQNRVTMKYAGTAVSLKRLAAIDKSIEELLKQISERLAALGNPSPGNDSRP